MPNKLECLTDNGWQCNRHRKKSRKPSKVVGLSVSIAESRLILARNQIRGSATLIARRNHTMSEIERNWQNSKEDVEKGRGIVAKCSDCIHQPVCEVWGGLFQTRNDVEQICEHFIQNDKPVGFDEFWKKKFENKK